MPDFSLLRRRMVDNQLRTFDVTDYRVQAAMETVPREVFVPASLQAIAYSDEMIPLETEDGTRNGRAMMTPAVLGRLLQALKIGPQDVALVVGAGTGYSTAVVAQLAGSVIALECDPDLAASASQRLERLDVMNAAVVTGPLIEGYPSDAPFDVILVEGAVEAGLDTLMDQLKLGGRLGVVEGVGLAGRARVYTRSESTVSGWTIFNAAAPVLPGFQKPEAFVF